MFAKILWGWSTYSHTLSWGGAGVAETPADGNVTPKERRDPGMCRVTPTQPCAPQHDIRAEYFSFICCVEKTYQEPPADGNVTPKELRDPGMCRVTPTTVCTSTRHSF